MDVFGLACEMRRYRDRMVETEVVYNECFIICVHVFHIRINIFSSIKL